jgi:hypothetical protein
MNNSIGLALERLALAVAEHRRHLEPESREALVLAYDKLLVTLDGPASDWRRTSARHRATAEKGAVERGESGKVLEDWVGEWRVRVATKVSA